MKNFSIIVSTLLVISIFTNIFTCGKLKAEKLKGQNKITLFESEINAYEKETTLLEAEVDQTKAGLRKIEIQNGLLLEKIERQNQRIVSLSEITVQPLTKTDTVFVDQILYKEGVTKFTDYYPSAETPFITYDFDSRINKSTWEFSDLNLGVVVTENRVGTYTAQVDGPEWIRIKDVEVNSLPFVSEQPKTVGFNLGGMMGYNLETKAPFLGLNTGLRVKKDLYQFGVTTNKDVYLGYQKLF